MQSPFLFAQVPGWFLPRNVEGTGKEEQALFWSPPTPTSQWQNSGRALGTAKPTAFGKTSGLTFAALPCCPACLFSTGPRIFTVSSLRCSGLFAAFVYSIFISLPAGTQSGLQRADAKKCRKDKITVQNKNKLQSKLEPLLPARTLFK